jgi:hypothetical protein
MLVLATPAIALRAATPTTDGSRASSAADSFYPYELPLTFEITHGDGHELSSVTELAVTVQRVGDERRSTILSPMNPFTPANGCTRPMPAGLAACIVNDDHSVGTLRVNWQVPEPGTYRIEVSAKRGAGARETIVVFTLDTVE